MQNLSSVAPPPLPDEVESIDTTYDIPTYVPTQGGRPLLRTVGWAMVIGGAVALAVVLMAPKLLSPAAQIAVPVPPALPAAPQLAAQVQEAPPAKVEPAQLMKKARRTKRAPEAAAAVAIESKEMNIRIRARVAPVRSTPDGNGKVLCSVKRGAVMRSVRQTPGSKGRWFGVSCDKDSPGWVHENFVSSRP